MTTILVADDISENRYLLEAIFAGLGYEVVSAENGEVAFEMALRQPPDLIVTDILMPVMDGFELCRRWNANERLRGIPFVFYTATYTDQKDERFAYSLGATRFVVKPQKPDVLVRLVQEVLEEARQRTNVELPFSIGEEMQVLKQYNEVLFRKLTKKLAELEAEIQERTKIQEAFEESQAKLVEAHRLAHIGLWEWDLTTDTVSWTEELYRIAGIDSKLPAPSFKEHSRLFTPEDWKRLNESVDRALRTAESYEIELGLIRPDGTERWVVAIGGVKCSKSGHVVRLHGMVQDITERKQGELERQKLEEQLRLSQKMEAMGSLAGGVAHDFNNVLSVILSFVGFAIRGVSEGDPLRDDLIEIKKAAERAAALTRQLLAFSRKQVLEVQAIDLNHVVTNLERMLVRLIREDIEFTRVPAQGPAWVRADPGQIEQVIVNLVVNARDAMLQGGTLIIEIRSVDLNEEFAKTQGALTVGPYVVLEVTDTGCGMDPATQKRLFEPFFTTKEVGKGTGLGLSTVYGIVKQSGGHITVHSELGKGSSFKVYLPRLVEAIDAPPRSSKLGRDAVGRETILVVEDEDAVRKATVRMLREARYDVLSAANGGEALLLCESHSGEIHLLVTDVVMPNMSGSQLVDRLHVLRPNLRVLFMSGYTDGSIAHHGILKPNTWYIGKPFGATELTRKVREVLDNVPCSNQ
jgi:PAS domain S-box-containing protein